MSDGGGVWALQISFGAILTPLGVGLLAYGFGAFFQLLPGTEASALMLIYGFPISLLGFALSYAQLKPVPCRTTSQALSLRDSQATNIQKQVCAHDRARQALRSAPWSGVGACARAGMCACCGFRSSSKNTATNILSKKYGGLLQAFFSGIGLDRGGGSCGRM